MLPETLLQTLLNATREIIQKKKKKICSKHTCLESVRKSEPCYT